MGALDKSEYRRMHEEDDAVFVEYLRTLAPEDWERPTLCEEWAVRDIVGHILYGNELNLWTFPFKLARHGFSIDRGAAVYSKARAAGRTSEELLADFAVRDRWAGSCRVFPAQQVLLDRLVHQQDVRRPLGHPREIPEEHLLACLEGTPELGMPYGTKKKTQGLRFVATDVDWSWGEGPEVTGPAEALVMALLGRRPALDDLDGPGLATFRSR